MVAGIQPTQASINAQAAQLVLALKENLYAIQQFQDFLIRLGAAGLEAPPYNFAPGDAAVLLSAYGDLSSLAEIFLGQIGQNGGAAYSYLTFAGLLTGFS